MSTDASLANSGATADSLSMTSNLPASPVPFLEVRELKRWFDGVRAVNGVSFAVPAGQVVGLIGANGAGKTTAMRILATLDLPDRGQVLLGGVDIVESPNEVRRRIGWMPDHFGPYADTTVADYLDFLKAQGVYDNTRIVIVSDHGIVGPVEDHSTRATAGGTTPGLFVRIRVPAAGQRESVLVQDRAIGTDLDRRYVYVVGADDTVAYRPVTLGPLVDGLRVLRSGVEAGERVVVNGIQHVRPGLKVQPDVTPME